MNIRVIIGLSLVLTNLEFSFVVKANSYKRHVEPFKASITMYPYQVALLESYILFCGGSLISPQWVLSAAHCFYEKDRELSQCTARAGSAHSEHGGYLRGIRTVYTHWGYNPDNRDLDVSLVLLVEELPMSLGVRPIALPAPNEKLKSGTKVVVTGWGHPGKNINGEPDLQAMRVTYIEKNDCESLHTAEITHNMFCAGGLIPGGTEACVGDSGGPLVHNHIQYGVVSWGEKCGTDDYPGVLTDVSLLRFWIRGITGI